MSVDHIRYDILTQNALRGLVRTVFADVAQRGLPGDHHFFVALDTTAPGVRISPRLQAQYPTEMTIVLQHQFWDLKVGEDTFEVGLSFNGVPERLVVPFAAIKGFFDPSVQFELQFSAATEDGLTPHGDAGAPDTLPDEPQAPPSSAEPDDQKTAAPDDGGAVVRLDLVPKKK